MIHSLFNTIISILGQQLPVHGHCIENFTSKVEAWGLSDRKKGSILWLCFRVVDDVPEKKGMDLWKQMLSKWSFTCICGIFLPLNPSLPRLQFMLGLHFALSLHFTLSRLQSAFYRWFAVCTPQSAVYVLHWVEILEAATTNRFIFQINRFI